MSRRRSQRGLQTEPLAMLCGCGAPTRDGAGICDPCLAAVRRTLESMPGLVAQLSVTFSGQRSPSLTVTGSSSASPEPRWDAAKAREGLSRALARWAGLCPHPETMPDRQEIITLAGWLRLRLPVLALRPEAGQMPADLGQAVARAQRVIDVPPPIQYLGTCSACHDGDVYARAGQDLAACRSCGAAIPARERRDALLAELDDRLVTAAEAAQLCAYLGLRDPRDRVRQRLNQWHKRGRISPETGVHATPGTTDPRFRFGLIWRLLVADDERRAS